jgi:hypothetical protein
MKNEFYEGGVEVMKSTRVFMRNGLRVATALLLTAGVVGCAQTVVQPKYEQRTAGPVARPSQVLVYDFAITTADVTENQGFFAAVRNSLSDTTENERDLEIARGVQNRMSEELIAGIRGLGLPAQRAARGSVLPSGAIAVIGLFLDVDEGNRLQRTALGFGAGQSKVDTKVELYAPSTSGPTKLLEFTTHADSGSMPGALVTGAAGAAASGGMTAGVAATNLAASGVKGYRSQVEQMTARSADQAVAYLSEYFAKQGWIPQEKVKQAKQAGE